VIKLLASRTFFQSILVINLLLVLLPVFFLFNSSLRESNEFARTPLLWQEILSGKIIRGYGARVSLALTFSTL